MGAVSLRAAAEEVVAEWDGAIADGGLVTIALGDPIATLRAALEGDSRIRESALKDLLTSAYMAGYADGAPGRGGGINVTATVASLLERAALATPAIEPGIDERTCWRCEGRGWVRNGDPDDGRMTGRDNCAVCGGTGRVPEKQLEAEIARMREVASR